MTRRWAHPWTTPDRVLLKPTSGRKQDVIGRCLGSTSTIHKIRFAIPIHICKPHHVSVRSGRRAPDRVWLKPTPSREQYVKTSSALIYNIRYPVSVNICKFQKGRSRARRAPDHIL